MMKIDILTLFPEMFSPLEHSIVGNGGGQGMLLRAQPIFDAFDAIEKKNPRVILLDPAGKQFDQAYAEDLAQEEELIFICGHYEGYDERIKTLVTDEISLGDYVLTGGELAAMTMIDATVRLIPEVIGKESSHQDDSFSSGLLEYPQYTRPYDYRGMVVPDVLMSGHHEKIRQWRPEGRLKKKDKRRRGEWAKFERVVNSAEYQKIAAQSPSYFAWGRMMELAGENQDAQQMMNIFLQASWQSESQESFSKTLEYADKVLANKAISSKDAINTQFLRGEMLRKLGRFDEAKRVFTALQKNPEVKKDKLFSQLAALQLSLVAKKSMVSEIIDFDKK